MAFFDSLEVLYNAARGIIPFGKSTVTGVPVPFEVTANGLKVDAYSSGGTGATESTLQSVLTAVGTNTSTIVAELAEDAGQSEHTVIALRTFSNTVSDADTDAASFVAITPQLGAVQVEFNALVFGNTAGVTATSVRFRIYGRAGAEIFLVDAFDVLKANAEATVANRLSNLRYNVQCDELAVTMRFLDGTSPIMVSGNVTARPISLSAKESSSEKIGVTTGLPKVEQLGYDSTIDAQKIVVLNDLYPRLPEPNVVSGASLSIATAYWPSSAGVACGGYKAVSFDGSITGAGGASAVTVTAESSIDGTVWRDITLGTLDEINHAYLTAALTAAAGASLAWLWTCPTPGAYVRLKVVVTTNITGAYALSICRHQGDV